MKLDGNVSEKRRSKKEETKSKRRLRLTRCGNDISASLANVISLA